MDVNRALVFPLLWLALATACVSTGARTADGGGSRGSGGTGGSDDSGGSGGGAGSGGTTVTCPTASSDPAVVDGGVGAIRDISSMDLVKDMGVGWNLGNTFDASGGETSWGNPPTTQAMIQAIADAGFKSVRIPVTWVKHFGGPPCYPIDAAWMARVQQIVDWVIGAGMYAIVNMHHDGLAASSGGWILNAATNYNGVMAEYKALWSQIAGTFRGYSDYLVFESMNEVGFDSLKRNGATSQAGYDLLNRINAEFVSLIRASGGNNGQRHLLIAGYWTDIDQTVAGWVKPNDSRSILSIHYYTPYQFCINGNPTTWGSTAEIATLKNQFAKLKTKFLDQGIPVILGEFGAVRSTEAASRVFWVEYVTKTAHDMGIAPYFWDNGEEFNRMNLTWRTAGLVGAIQRAASGQSYTIVKGT